MRDTVARRLLALAISGSCLLSAAAASPLGPKSKRQQSAGESLAVTGINQGDVQPRLEIRDLAKDEFQWNLFLLAMQRFQQMDQDERTSWYSVAGKSRPRPRPKTVLMKSQPSTESPIRRGTE